MGELEAVVFERRIAYRRVTGVASVILRPSPSHPGDPACRS
ncbi:hypothetical protein ACFZDG_32355 [Kitasatospora xanthocidica]